jgi:type IV pilus assembly protein PilW
MLLGAGADGVLHGLDLLAPGDATPQALAEGVVAVHALYGVDTDLDGKVDTWASPASGDFALAALSAGDDTAAGRLQQILAVRVGLVLRSLRPDKEMVAPQTLTLFADLGKDLAVTRKLEDAERVFRHLAIEQTVPVRNNLLLRTP